MKVFQKTFISINIFLIGGLPYFICTIMNRTDGVPWPFYSTAFLFVSFTSVIQSIVLLMTNEQVRRILLAKLTGGRSMNVVHNRGRIRMNQIVPYHIKIQTTQPLIFVR